MPSKGMKKLRQVEKIGLIGLCVVMLGTLGIGTTTVFKGCGQEEVIGSFVIDGEEFKIDRVAYRDYWTFLTFQNGMMPFPPFWKFAFPGDRTMTNYQADEKDVWTFIILDHVAKKAGVTIPPKAVQDWIKDNFTDRQTRRYDRATYERFLSATAVKETWPTAAMFEKFITRWLTVKYLVACYNPLLWPTMDQVYDRWKYQNKRHDFEYVVQSIAALRREIDPAAFTAEEVQKHYDLDKTKRNFRVPTRRAFEAAYVLPGEVTDEQMTRLREIAEKDNLVAIGPREGFQFYYDNVDRLFPDSVIVDPLREKWEAEQKAKKDAEKEEEKDGAEEEKPSEDKPAEDKPAEEKPAEEKPAEEKPAEDTDKQGAADEPEAPSEDEAAAGEEAPGGDETPSGEEVTAGPEIVIPGVTDKDEFVNPLAGLTPQKKYDDYFKERVEKELFLKLFIERLLKLEETDKEGLSAIVERTGLPYFVTERPLDQNEIYDLEPVGGQAIREALNRFAPDMAGQYADKIILFGEDEKRGYAMIRVSEVQKEHFPKIDEEVELSVLQKALWNVSDVALDKLKKLEAKEAILAAFPDADLGEKTAFAVSDIVRLMLRQDRAEEQAREKLNGLMEAVTAGNQSFKSAAEERAFRIFTETGATKGTNVRRPDDPEEGEEAKEFTPEEESARRLMNYRYFLLRGFSGARGRNIDLIDGTDANRFVADVLVDSKSDAAFAVYVTAHTMPAAEEMPDIEAQNLKRQLMDFNRRSTLRTFFDFERITGDYDLKVDGLTVNVKKVGGEGEGEGEGQP